MHGVSGEVCWGIGGGEGSCGKRYGECGGRCREMCWGERMSEKRCVGSLFSCIFILLSRESDQCAIRARLGVAGHLSTTPRWGNPAKCLSRRHNK